MALLIKMLRKQKALAAVAACVSGLAAAVTLWWNAQLSGIINLVSVGTAPPWATLATALVTMLAMCATGYAKGYLSGYACERMTHDLRMGYARGFMALPLAACERLNAGEQLSTLQNEIAGVSSYLNTSLFQLFDDGVRFLTTFIWLLLLSPSLTLLTNLPVFLIMAYVVWSSKMIETATARSQQAKGRMNQFADTLLTLFPILRLYDASRLTMDGYASAVNAWEGHTVRAERTRARLMSISALLTKLPLLLLFLMGGHMAIQGVLTIGTLYIFLNLSQNVSGVLMNMPGHISAFRQFTANMKRLEGKVCL